MDLAHIIHWTTLNNAHTFFIPATKGIESSSALADGGVGGRGVTNSDNRAASPDGAKCTPSYGIHGTNIHINTIQDSRFCLRMYLYQSCLIQCYVNACRVLNLQEFSKNETPLSNSTQMIFFTLYGVITSRFAMQKLARTSE